MTQKFREGDTVRIRDTDRVRKLNKILIGTRYTLYRDQAVDLNEGFPTELGTCVYMPEDLVIENLPYKGNDIATKGGDSDLDRMERQMEENEDKSDSTLPYHLPGWADPYNLQDVAAIRSLLKTPTSSSYSDKWEGPDLDQGMTAILITKPKKRRHALIVSIPPGIIQITRR